MEMAIANAATPLSSYLQFSKPHTFSSSFSTPPHFSKNKNAVFCGLMKTHQRMEPMSVKGRFGSSRGGPDLLERPTFDQSQFDPHCREKRVCLHLPSSMEMAIANAATPLSSYLKISKPHTFSSSFSTPPHFSKNKNAVFCGLMKTHQRMEPMSVKGRFGSSRGGPDLLERPTFDQSQFDPLTQAEAGGDIGQVGDKKATRSGDGYKVLLIDDERHTEELVAKVLPRVVPSVSPDDARILFHKSREAGVVVVIVTVKEHAEFYAQMMIRGGLRSAIEPDSGTA